MATTNSKKTLRFAHPFQTNVPIADRQNVPNVGTRMTDFVQTKLEPIPVPQREPTMTLAEIIGDAGAAEIAAGKSIIFHATGDTGLVHGEMQELVAESMATEYNVANPEKSPAFFLHLGDVVYYDNTDSGYHQQFYVPYKNYPGKIIAIPGNHDGELFKYDGTSTGQKVSLEAFQKNFCQPKPGVPPAAGTIYREMISQPGVYWVLNAPYVDIIGLYSNMAENPGYISAPSIGNKQKDWLTKTLTNIAENRKKGSKKALIIAVHHPPISTSGHSSSTEMLADIDDSCKKAGIMPDAVLAAHAHNYQRYTRYITFNGIDMEIPFIVCGGGGRVSQPVETATGAKDGDHSFDKSLRGNGFLTITVTKDVLTINFTQVSEDKNKHFVTKKFDSVTVNLKSNKLK